MRKRLLKFAAAWLVAMALPAIADDYPSRAVTMVVPYGAGGAADVSARLLVGPAGEVLGQPVVAVNKTGAGGVIGSSFVINSPADGYTMLSARVGSQMGVPAMNKTIPYTWDGFTIIGLTETNPFVLVVPASSPINSFKEFEAKVKAKEDMTFASTGVGTLLHIATAVMADTMGVGLDNLTHVPFKGGGAAQTAIISAKVDFMWQNLSGVIGAIEAGQLKALAVTTPQRFEAVKDVPTVGELGYPAMEQIIGWSAVYGPPGLPENVVSKWTAVLESLKTNDDWKKRASDLGNVVDIRGPEETKAFVERQYKVFDSAIKKLGMRVE